MTWFGEATHGLELYHVGLVVPDIREAMELYSEAFGFAFTNVAELAVRPVVGGHVVPALIAMAYSTAGPVHLELIEDLDGGVWHPGGSPLNHVGFWTDDVGRSKEKLDAQGFPGVVFDATPNGIPELYSYHRGPGSFWVELIASSWKVDLDAMIAEVQQ